MNSAFVNSKPRIWYCTSSDTDLCAEKTNLDNYKSDIVTTIEDAVLKLKYTNPHAKTKINFQKKDSVENPLPDVKFKISTSTSISTKYEKGEVVNLSSFGQ